VLHAGKRRRLNRRHSWGGAQDLRPAPPQTAGESDRRPAHAQRWGARSGRAHRRRHGDLLQFHDHSSRGAARPPGELAAAGPLAASIEAHGATNVASVLAESGRRHPDGMCVDRAAPGSSRWGCPSSPSRRRWPSNDACGAAHLFRVRSRSSPATECLRASPQLRAHWQDHMLPIQSGVGLSRAGWGAGRGVVGALV